MVIVRFLRHIDCTERKIRLDKTLVICAEKYKALKIDALKVNRDILLHKLSGEGERYKTLYTLGHLDELFRWLVSLCLCVVSFKVFLKIEFNHVLTTYNLCTTYTLTRVQTNCRTL